MVNDNLKTYEIKFTTDQETPFGGWYEGDMEEFWYGMYDRTDFGQSYSMRVIDLETATVMHTVGKFFDCDPRKQDAAEVASLIEEWISEVNAFAPEEDVQVREISLLRLRKEVA